MFYNEVVARGQIQCMLPQYHLYHYLCIYIWVMLLREIKCYENITAIKWKTYNFVWGVWTVYISITSPSPCYTISVTTWKLVIAIRALHLKKRIWKIIDLAIHCIDFFTGSSQEVTQKWIDIILPCHPGISFRLTRLRNHLPYRKATVFEYIFRCCM